LRIFLDANVLFSAARSDGAVRQLCSWLVEAGHECVADEYVVTEARRNLAAWAPRAERELDTLLQGMTVSRAQQPGAEARAAEWLPEKDRPIFMAAIRLRCDALVTGDRTHFGRGYGKTFGGVVIHSPRSLAEALMRPR
jgi:predicted nucleic acid-binding protein